jgi:hypothetical protein
VWFTNKALSGNGQSLFSRELGFMRIPDNLSNTLLYLDPSFISLAWEEHTGNSPTTKISNDAGLEGKLSFGFAGFGSSIKETKSYEISTFRMLHELRSELETYPTFDPDWFLTSRKTRLCWLDGSLTIGEWESGSDASMTFELFVGEKRHTLVIQRDLFRSSIGFLTNMESAISMNIDIPVTALGLVLFDNPAAHCDVTSPYLIFSRDPD